MNPTALGRPHYGLIVEGVYDEGVFSELVRKIVAPQVSLTVRVCGGVPHLMRKFPTLLRTLEYACEGKPVDKAFVIRDYADRDPLPMERKMIERLQGRRFDFSGGVQFCMVRQEMETWLLADGDAINSLAHERGGRTVPQTQGQLEEINDPKQALVRLLSRARLPYDAQVCREIARRANIEVLRYCCPSFRSFESKLISR